MTFRKHLLVACYGASWTALLAGTPVQAADEITAKSSEETVVVTAERRTTNLQKTAISATVLSGQTLEKKGVTGLTALQFAAPGVQISDYGSANTFNIRGIGQAQVDVDLPSGVSIYRDGVPTLTGYFQNAPYYDMASIEVLRGPQGTFGGKSTSAGAVFIRTNDPVLGDDGFTGSIMAGYGNRSFVESTGVLNAPISDTFALRFAYHVEDRDSLLDSIRTNPRPGAFGDGAGPYNGDDNRRLQSIRVGALWKPSEHFSAVLKLDYDWLYFGSHIASGFDPITNAEQDIRNPIVNGLHIYRDKGARASLKLSYAFDGGITLNALTGYSLVNSLANWDANGDNPRGSGFQSSGIFKNYSQEFNLVSPEGERLNWVVGVFVQRYLNQPGSLYGQRTTFNFVNNNGNRPDFTSPWEKNETNYAAFGQIGYRITDALEVQVGARWNHYKFSQFTNFLADFSGLGGVGPDSPYVALEKGGLGYKQYFKEESTDWKVNLNYQVNDDHFLYAVVSRGHTPGSINLFEFSDPHTAYKEMSVINYEAGWKGSFNDGQIKTQLDGYYQTFENYQAGFALQNPNLPNNPVASIFQNAKTTSTIWGIEFGIQAHFGDFGIDGGLAYSRSKLGSFGLVQNIFQPVYGGPAFINLNGARTPFAPEWTANIGMEYVFHLSGGDNGATITPRFDLAYRSDSYASLFQNAATFLPSVTLLNANIRYDNGPWAIELWGTNLTDEKYVSAKQNVSAGTDALYPNPHIVGIIYGAPRRLFGVRVTRNF